MSAGSHKGGQNRYPGSRLLALRRTLLYFALLFALMPLQAMAVAFNWPLKRRLPQRFHQQGCRILGIRVERRGRMSRAAPTLFASNHTSYWDIVVLGSLIPASFVAKSEVARWPFFGLLAKLQRSVFVDRRANRAGKQRDEMVRRLEHGDSLILFPEGTSDDGNRVLPFKSALFAVAELRPHGKPLVVQPVSISYTRLDGMPIGRYLRPYYAWYGDMELLGHLWQALGLGHLTVVVEFHPPVTLESFPSRKALASHCQEAVADGVAAALTGRPIDRKKSGAQAAAAPEQPAAEAGSAPPRAQRAAGREDALDRSGGGAGALPGLAPPAKA